MADAAPEATKQRQATAEEKLYALGYAWDGTEWIKVKLGPMDAARAEVKRK